MQQTEIHQFLERYFNANECQIVENHPGYMNVQLTIDMDKELMNRPFYWHYLEKTGGVPNPMRLCLITNQEKAPENVKGEVLHFGSPRLHQIFRSARKLASYTRLYENKTVMPGKQTPLQPWLGLNIKVSYQCDLKKDLLKSIGLNLINGTMKENFHQELMKKNLTPKIPDFSFTLTPIIKPKSGIARIRHQIQGELQSQPTDWAEAARARWQEDLDLLDQFYEGQDEKPESYHVEKQALAEQYEPKILVEIINGGLFYLTP
ncbi:YqhG family protein [Bacillus sp. SCS-153A]|uniref:YqhG family protein n=1 Tax=Rossellomorea sedimentorum TaxID=3115294 RepID=UPI003906CC50